MKNKINGFLNNLIKKNNCQPEFIQSVSEIIPDIFPIILENPLYQKNKILDRLVEPERIIVFRINWLDDNNEVKINRGYRVQMNSAIGPYKGGLRFHPTVNLSVLKFLAFEQIFKNALTTLPLGSGKGGSDFNPKGKTENEIMKFCQAYMSELFRHIGSDTDIPAGDIGVGRREIGYLFGQYKKLKNKFTGALTGKGLEYGGSKIRLKSTGYGIVYFTNEMLKTKNMDLKDKTIVISGSGNVAQYTVEKCIELGGKVVTLSDSNGFIYDKNGITQEKLNYILELKNIKHERIKKYSEKFKCEYYKNQKPWNIKCDIAFPCATQNELNLDDAKSLINNNCKCVVEGANMPCTLDAVKYFLENKILYAPGKAANAGGVSVSGLEISQNKIKFNWSEKEVNKKLKDIMLNIHNQCLEKGAQNNYVNYLKGANISGFIKVAEAMLAQGII